MEPISAYQSGNLPSNICHIAVCHEVIDMVFVMEMLGCHGNRLVYHLISGFVTVKIILSLKIEFKSIPQLICLKPNNNLKDKFCWLWILFATPPTAIVI